MSSEPKWPSHDWLPRFGLIVCGVCGYVQNDSNRKKPCRGGVRLTLRKEPANVAP